VRILIVGLGGVTATFRNWPERIVAVALAARGHEVRAIGTHDPSRPALAARRERVLGVDVQRVRNAYWPNLELATALADGPRPDLVHLWHPRNVLAAQVTAWARRRGIPTVYTWNGPYHDQYLVDDREHPLLAAPRYDRLIWTRTQLLRRLVGARSPRAARDLVRNYRLHWPLRAATHLIPCSRHEAVEMRRMGFAKPMTIVSQWIEPAAIAAASEPPVSSVSRPWLLFVGQLTPRKGWDLAVAALPAIRRRYPTASLLVVSGLNPAGRDEVLRKSAGLGIAEHVHFLGRLEDAELGRLFHDCDAYLAPSRYEGFGLTLLEAMAAGAPIVASEVPAVNEIVRHEQNGLLFPPDDEGALAAATLRVLDDAPLRDRLREAGTRTLREQFDPDRLLGELEAVYRQVVDSPGPPGARARRALRDRGAGYVLRTAGREIASAITSSHAYNRAFKSLRTFSFEGRRYRYFLHRYNSTWRNERAVEIPIVHDVVQQYQGKRILEVGNVLAHYFPATHDRLDKYEAAPGVINQDVVDFRPDRRYDLIVSISTLEHVGWDEEPREPDKPLRALSALRGLLAPGGRLLFTLPLAYNPHLDGLFWAGRLGLSRQCYLKRISTDNRWRQVEEGEVRSAAFDRPFRRVNALVIAVIEGPPASAGGG
jgi:glycogen synthase